MSQALDLLNSLSAEEISKYAGTSPNEEYIVIGRDRTVYVPPQLRRIAVQHDRNIEYVRIACPRFWDGVDMVNGSSVYINYMRSDGYTDQCPLRVKGGPGIGDPNYGTMYYDWKITENVTKVPGPISFLVYISGGKTPQPGSTIDDPYEPFRWHSELCRDMYVSEGLECDPQEIISDPDLVTELLVRMSEVEKVNVTSEEINQVRDETLAAQAATEEARDIALDEAHHIRNSYANAVKGNASGSIIQVNDVSPVEHDVRVQVRGKNLLDLSEAVGITSDNTPSVDGDALVFPVNGKEAWGVKWSNVPLQVGQTYTLSVKDASKHDATWGWRIKYTDGTYYDAAVSPAMTVTIDKPVELVSFYISWGAFTLDEQVTVEQLMAELGPTATDYETYIDPSTVTVTACGKNLIAYPYSEMSKTRAGVTYTVDDSGVISYNGTSTGSYLSLATYDGRELYLHEGFTYTFSGLPSDSSMSTTYAHITESDGETRHFVANNSTTFTATSSGYVKCTLVVSEGTVASGKFKPMLAIGGSAVPFEPYIGSTVTPTPDGTCTVASVSPTMTVYCDTPGVTVEVEYTRDTNKVLMSVPSNALTLDDVVQNLMVEYDGKLPASADAVVNYCRNFDSTFVRCSDVVQSLADNANSSDPVSAKAVASAMNALSKQDIPEFDANDSYYILRVKWGGDGLEFVNIAEDMYLQTWVAPYLLPHIGESHNGKIMQVVDGSWQLVDAPSGGSGSNTLIVTYDEDSGMASKTAGEIHQHFLSGGTVVFERSPEDHYALVHTNEWYAVFVDVDDGGAVYSYMIDHGGLLEEYSYAVISAQYATEVNDRLNALETAAGDIDAALDSIIAIQNGLIGGGI